MFCRNVDSDVLLECGKLVNVEKTSHQLLQHSMCVCFCFLVSGKTSANSETSPLTRDALAAVQDAVERSNFVIYVDAEPVMVRTNVNPKRSGYHLFPNSKFDP